MCLSVTRGVIVKQKSRNAREYIYLRYNTKNPLCNALSMTKAARGKRKVSVAGRTL